MNRFKLLAFAFVAIISVACSTDDNDGIEPGGNGSDKSVVIDFEEAELGDVTLDGYNPTTYHNVLTGKPLAEKCVDEDNVYLVDCMVYDGLLYAENGVSFGSFYSDFEALWGGVYDTCYGFVMSSNNDIEEGTVANQYSVYSATNGANKFAVAYDCLLYTSPSPRD